MSGPIHGLWQQLAGHAALWLLVVLVMLLLRRHVHAWAEQKAASNSSAGDSRAIMLFARIYVPALTLLGLYLSLELVELPTKWQDRAEHALLACTYVVFMVIVWRGLSALARYWSRTNPNAGTLLPPIQLVGRLLLALLTLALVLSAYEKRLTNLWTALGIGSIAIALALQETLGNTFAGFHLMMDQPIRPGDYIKTESGEEGRVLQIGWRSTRLLSLSNNLVVIPNGKLARASITNYSIPETRMGSSVSVSVTYESDTRRVAAILQELVKTAALEVEGMLSEPAPSVRFIPGFGESSLDFSVYFQVRDFVAQFAVQDELRHRILERFRQERIEFAYPVRDVRVKGEGRAAGL